MYLIITNVFVYFKNLFNPKAQCTGVIFTQGIASFNANVVGNNVCTHSAFNIQYIDSDCFSSFPVCIFCVYLAMEMYENKLIVFD